MGTRVVCTRLQVAPDGVSSKTRSALPLTLKTSTSGASTVGVSPGRASPVAPEGGGGRGDQARPPGSTSKTDGVDFGRLRRTATRPSAPTALARTESAPGSGKRGRHGPAGVVLRPGDFERPMPCPAHGGEQPSSPRRRSPAARRTLPPPATDGQGGARQVPRPIGLAEQADPSTTFAAGGDERGAGRRERHRGDRRDITGGRGPAERGRRDQRHPGTEALGRGQDRAVVHDGEPGLDAGRLDRQRIGRRRQGARQEDGAPRGPSITARATGGRNGARRSGARRRRPSRPRRPQPVRRCRPSPPV